MTRWYRGRSRRLNGSMVIRSVSKACRLPPGPGTGPSRRRISVNAGGQSSSVPSSIPIRCLVLVVGTVKAGFLSAEPRHVMGELGAPGRPVVRRVVTPHVQLVLYPLAGQQRCEALGAGQRPGGVLPLALTAHQQQADLAAQPLQVVTRQVADVVDRVVEVHLVALLAPGAPGRRVIVAGKAHGQREQVSPLEREVGRVEGAHAAAQGDDLGRAATVPVDPRHHVADDPRLVPAVPAGAFLEWQVVVRPGRGVIAVDAVELDRKSTRL